MKRLNKVIALMLALLMLLPSLLMTLSSCKKDDNGGSNSGNGGNGGSSSTQTESYSVTVVTKGGMPMAKLPVYVWEYEDGELGELVDGGIAATDENGKATFKLPKGGSYAAKIDGSMPEGYDVQSYYPLVSNNMTITVSSQIIPETSLAGVSYKLGDVMRDFTFNTTILVEDENGKYKFEDRVFTLSEVLKEKKAVLINFWYTTCSWCITEFPLMQEAYENYSDDIAIIALDPYQDDTLMAIQEFQANMGLTFNVAQDESDLTTAFNVGGYPTSVIVDRYGVISMIEEGAITSERAFDVVFSHFTSDNYDQKLIYDYADIVPKEKPNVEMPDSDEISEVFDGGLDRIEYAPYPSDASDDEKEYSWPFVISTLDDGTKVINPSNANKESSYAQLIMNVSLDAGEVVAFDYYSSTELRADILYVIVDGKDIYSISGESDEWATCFAYVAEEAADYEIALIYQKDSSDNVGNDTVYLKNLRICGIEDINSPTYIYRFAATNPDRFNVYQDYVEIFYNEADGYYHVDSVNGPILLANLMGYTRFSDDNYVYNMGLGKDYEASITRYCNYASNSEINGVCPVTEDLKGLLIKIAKDYGVSSEDDNIEWLKLCCYYDSYGTDDELADPIKGLSVFSAYDVVLSNKGDTDFPNSITYNRIIMPRGLFSKFTPAESGTYLITSYAPDPNKEGAFIDCDAWIFTAQGFDSRQEWYTYENVDRNNLGLTSDQSNCYMMVYLEAGKDYYINIAFDDVYQEGTINFRVERLGGEGYYRFSLASPGYFTTFDNNGQMTSHIVAGGIDVELGDDGIWREKRTDNIDGSILYADFTNITPIFTTKSLEQMIDLGGFDFTKDEDGEAVVGGEDLTELARSFLAKKIVAGYNADLDEVIAEDDDRIGCIIVTEELAELLQKLMDKYTFMNGEAPDNLTSIDHSWTKLCYYHHYFSAVTPY